MNSELLTLLGIDESDLVANRAGRMGEHQKAILAKERRRLTYGAVGGGVALGLLTVLLVIQHSNGWPVMLAVGVFWVGLCSLLAAQDRRGATAKVYCLSGPFSVQKMGDGSMQGIAHTSVALHIDGKRCTLPSGVSDDVDRWRSALGAGSLRVYAFDAVRPKMVPRIVGIEPIDP